MARRPALPWIVVCGLFAVGLVYVLTTLSGPPGTVPVSAPLPTQSPHGDGLTDTHDGFQLTPVTLPSARGTKQPVVFRIAGPNGPPEYETVHTKPLHLYVIRDDLTAYQHLHPSYADGAWTAEVDVPDGGAYRVYAEFTPKGRGITAHPTVLGIPFVVTGDTAFHPVPRAVSRVEVAGFTVRRLDGTANLVANQPTLLRFQVLAGQQPAALEPYLGAFAHVSAFDVLTQGLIHMHPVLLDAAPPDGVLTFHAQFPFRGEQRVFLQFQVAGVVREAAFTLVVN